MVSMVCAGACYDMEETMEYAPYSTDAKYCSECRVYLFIDSISCRCCHKRLRTKPKKRLPHTNGLCHRRSACQFNVLDEQHFMNKNKA